MRSPLSLLLSRLNSPSSLSYSSYVSSSNPFNSFFALLWKHSSSNILSGREGPKTECSGEGAASPVPSRKGQSLPLSFWPYYFWCVLECHCSSKTAGHTAGLCSPLTWGKNTQCGFGLHFLPSFPKAHSSNSSTSPVPYSSLITVSPLTLWSSPCQPAPVQQFRCADCHMPHMATWTLIYRACWGTRPPFASGCHWPKVDLASA